MFLLITSSPHSLHLWHAVMLALPCLVTECSQLVGSLETDVVGSHLSALDSALESYITGRLKSENPKRQTPNTKP